MEVKRANCSADKAGEGVENMREFVSGLGYKLGTVLFLCPDDVKRKSCCEERIVYLHHVAPMQSDYRLEIAESGETETL